MEEKMLFERKFSWRARFCISIAFIMVFIMLLALIALSYYQNFGLMISGLVVLIMLILIPLYLYSMNAVFVGR